VVGTATLATPVGQTTLGNYIFQGLQTRDQTATVFGCVFAALLAVVMDQLIRLLEVAARRRSRGLAWGGAFGLLLVLGGGLYAPAAELLRYETNPVKIGSLAFTEQHILSDVLAGKLRAARFSVKQSKGMGETIQYEALCHGQIDCCVDYSGNVWAVVMKRTEHTDRATTIAECTRYLREERGVICLGPLGYENAYALAMPRRRAQELGIRTIDDLARRLPRCKMGGDDQFFGRPEWVAVRDAYGLHGIQPTPMDPTLMYSAVVHGSVDVICAYSSDGRIKAYDLVLLEDPRQTLPPYDAMLLLSPQAAARPDLVAALRPLVGAFDLDTMQSANQKVDEDHEEPAAVARWLLDRIGRQKPGR
jgi:osmoprotectant transport system permease protein